MKLRFSFRDLILVSELKKWKGMHSNPVSQGKTSDCFYLSLSGFRLLFCYAEGQDSNTHGEAGRWLSPWPPTNGYVQAGTMKEWQYKIQIYIEQYRLWFLGKNIKSTALNTSVSLQLTNNKEASRLFFLNWGISSRKLNTWRQ